MNHKNWLPDALFKKIYSQVPRLCVDLVIVDQRGVLLSLRNHQPYKNYWHLPGGTVYFGEKIEQAAKRVAKSELGLKVKVLQALGYLEYLGEIKLADRHSISVPVLCKITGGKLSAGNGTEKVDFFKKLPSKIIVEQKSVFRKLEL